MKDGVWLSYYYLGGGVHPLTGGCHQGGRWVVGRVEGNDPLRSGWKDTLTLEAGAKILP